MVTQNLKVLLKKVLTTFLVLGMFFIIGCSETEEQEVVSTDVIAENEMKLPEVTEDNIIDSKIKSPLTGLYIDKRKLNDRVIAIMFDNQYLARPQAGISKCDIVYEILAEGNITRYMGVVGSEQPDNLGPIRSARDYFIDRALEYDALYVHVGGSPQAYEAISDLKIASVNGMNQGSDIFWRKSHKKKPHNMYSSYEAILEGAKRKSYRAEGQYEGLLFLENERIINGSDLLHIKFPYNGSKYYTSYQYNADEKIYDRYVNGKIHVDEDNDVPITAKNIIVQFTDTKLIPGDTEGRLAINMIGEGKGYYISNGKYMDIVWKKTSEYHMTKYYDASGREISLNPGNIWIQVFPTNKLEQIQMN